MFSLYMHRIRYGQQQLSSTNSEALKPYSTEFFLLGSAEVRVAPALRLQMGTLTMGLSYRCHLPALVLTFLRHGLQDMAFCLP